MSTFVRWSRWKYLWIVAAATTSFILLNFLWVDERSRIVTDLVDFIVPTQNQATTKPNPKFPPISNSSISEPEDEYVAICLSVKDQPKDLPEWFIHHYHHLGIRRFYILDDGSEPPLSTVKDYGIPKSAIHFDYYDKSKHTKFMQLDVYNECFNKYRSFHTWIAFIDGDEYLEATGTETLREILKTFEHDEKVGALGVNWRMHSSAGLLKRPVSARKGFTVCIKDEEGQSNEHIKSIVKTSATAHAGNPHKFDIADGLVTVGEHGDVIETIAWRTPITRDRIVLHHYAVRSRQEYDEKLLRGNGMSSPKGEDFWDVVENQWTHEKCLEMTQYDP